MAYLTTIMCTQCGQTRQAAVSGGESYPVLCTECRSKNAIQERLQFLKGLEGLSFEERLKKLEEFMYEHSRQFHRGPDIIY